MPTAGATVPQLSQELPFIEATWLPRSRSPRLRPQLSQELPFIEA